MKYRELSRDDLEKLLEDFAKRWLAHDGLWFQAAEQTYGMEEAIKLDIIGWEKFTVIEAQRIMSFLNLEPGGGLDALEKALNYRMYRFVNHQEIFREGNRLVLKMVECRVQEARRRKEMEPFPCKPVGEVEYREFARTIDQRIKTRCLGCPPDVSEETNFWCGWEFTL